MIREEVLISVLNFLMRIFSWIIYKDKVLKSYISTLKTNAVTLNISPPKTHKTNFIKEKSLHLLSFK